MAKPLSKQNPRWLNRVCLPKSCNICIGRCLIRRFEEKAGQLYGKGLIQGFCHLYIGQEAVVTACKQQTITGPIITSYRDYGRMLATGMDPKGVMAE